MSLHVQRGVIRRRFAGLGAIAAALFAHSVSAAPPSITGNPVQMALPNVGQTVVVDLRRLGVIAGSGPLILNANALAVLDANGNVAGLFSVNLYPNNGPGRICAVISNADANPGPGYQLRLQVSNYPGTATTPLMAVPITNTPGEVVDTAAEVAACDDPNTAPVANAGPDQTRPDTNGVAGESVTLNGSGSSDADVGTILQYTWRNALGATIATGVNPTVTLPDGANTLTLTVTDDSGFTLNQSATDTVLITVGVPTVPIVDAGATQTLADTNGVPGEPVTLSGTASDPDGTIAGYQWLLGQTLLGTTATLMTNLPDGTNTVTLIATDNAGLTALDTVQIIVNATAIPTANAGPDVTVNDTDNVAGETVTLNGAASTDPDGTIATFVWQNAQQQQIATGATPSVRLPDGQNVISLIVTDNVGNTAIDTVTIIVNAVQLPTANAGPDQIVTDTDGEVGEVVTLNGSASSDPNGPIASYVWTRLSGETTIQLGTGAILNVRLPDGPTIVTLTVQDSQGNIAIDTVLITVAVAVRGELSDLPSLTINKRAVAQALDRICQDLQDLDDGEGGGLNADQRDLLTKCNRIIFSNTAANQVQALEALGADDFAVARTQTLLFANTQYASVMERLMALRGGARGLSLAGLNIVVDGKLVPLATLQDMAKDLLGGGASADATEPGGLLSDKWGLWARGNYSFGEKDRSALSPSFEADQWALVGGLDYRVSDQSVIGVSIAYGQSSVEFEPSSEGGLDTTSWAASLYGSAYAAKNFYFDAILNIANAAYDADRNITYVDGGGLISSDAHGDTDGMTYSGGLSSGYDFLLGGLTVSPNVGFFYIDATIDGFTESGAGGLNLIYDEQNFKSLTGNLGLRLTYAWNQSWGVLLPHLRMDYVREFEDDVDVFGVRFAADPNAPSTPPILVSTDNPDQSYWRFSGGFSAQFKYGVSGYIEYQRLESFDFISFEDVSLGIRFQRSFGGP